MSEPTKVPHEWWDPGEKYPRLGGIICCKKCGACKPRDPKHEGSCRGVVRIGLRGSR